MKTPFIQCLGRTWNFRTNTCLYTWPDFLKITVYSLRISYHAPDPIHFSVLPCPPSTLVASPPKKKGKNKKKVIKKAHFAPPPCPPVLHKCIRRSVRGAAVCCAVGPCAQWLYLYNVHCNKLLVWFKASGFCYTIHTGHPPPPQTSLGYHAVAVMETLWL